MPYNVQIRNQQGKPLPGIIYFYDTAGTEIGMATVYPGGSEMDVEQVESAVHYWVTSPGYSPYGTSTLYPEGNTFTLFRSVPTYAYWGLGAIVALALAKLFKLKL